MYNSNDSTADEEADELRSLSTMDTLTFRRLREGRQRKKSKESDDETSVASFNKRSAASKGSGSMRRTNARGRDDESASMGDTLTTVTTGSGPHRWSRRGNSARGRNSRGEAAAAGTGRRCIIDICLVAVLGVVLLAKFGAVELELHGNMSKLRGGSDHPVTDGAAYAQWLDRQSKLAEYESDGDNKPVKLNNDHDAAEKFFDEAVHNLKNGLPQVQINDTTASDVKSNWQQQLDLGQSQQKIGTESEQQQQQYGQLQNIQSVGGVKSQYENAQPALMNRQPVDTQQAQDGSVQRAPEFQSFEQASIQHQLQQAIVQQQQQQAIDQSWQQPADAGADTLHPNNILDTNKQQLDHLIAEASDHGEDGFKLNIQHRSDVNGAAGINSMFQSAQGQINDPSMQQPAALPIGAAGVAIQDAAVGAESAQAAPLINRRLQVATWNIAAINNNPFEYWITYDENPEYENIMTSIENFLEEPGDKDVAVSDVFTEEMFTQLEKRMNEIGWDNVRSFWEGDFKDRKIISGFMKDPLLGSKRLASMPDRISNTINVVGSDEPVCRPTVINMYDGDLSTLELWWSAWERFMFDTPLAINNKGETVSNPVYKMLQPIKKAKYPDITEEEEKVSLPLQTMCGAIFDAILVHMMNTVSTPDLWQALKKTMVENLNKSKVPHTLDILEKVYGTSDIITLQEVSTALINQAKTRTLGEKYWIVAPGELDAVRDQNSVIFLSKATFPAGPSAEITSLVEGSFEQGVDVPIAKGDILAITAIDSNNTPYVIASFHGDTNGLATKPVLSAIMKTTSNNSALSSHKLVFGLDANTYEKAKPGKQQDVLEWGKHYVSLGLTSCWGDVPSPTNYTTFNSRTYLQPQLNKACKKSDKRSNGDVNPKDFILFGKGDFKVVKTWKDNTGTQKYIEDMAFPTLDFPSDHGILATVIEALASDSTNDHNVGAVAQLVEGNQKMLNQSATESNPLSVTMGKLM